MSENITAGEWEALEGFRRANDRLRAHITALTAYIRWLEEEDWPESLWAENRTRHGLRADLGIPEPTDTPSH